MFKKATTIILLVLLLVDIVYSFNQHLKAPLDGDMAHNIIPSPDYKMVLEDPFAIHVLIYKKPYGAPNRFFAHWFEANYFKTIPLFFKHFTSPINSVYVSCALLKTMIQFFIIFLLSLYIVYPVHSKQNILLAAVLLAPLFQAEGYNPYMGIIDKSITYTIFYALPLGLLLLFFFPFYKATVNNNPAIKLKSITSIVLFLLVFVLSFNGPLIPGVVMLICPMVLLYFFYSAYKNNPQYVLVKRITVSLISIPTVFLFYFLLFCLACLYSLYIGTYNTDGLRNAVSIVERYKKIPQGLFILLTQNLGFPLLVIMIVVNAVIIKTKYLNAEGKRILFLLTCVLLFSGLYILLLPFGGYRVYRPNIIRYDTFMPITIGLLFIYGLSSFYLICNLTPVIKKYYITAIVIFLSVYTYADGPLRINNNCEKIAIEKINLAKEDTVVLLCNCPVMDWEKTYESKYAEYNSQLLKYWGVFDEKKLYYHQRTDSLFLNKVELFKINIRKTPKWLEMITKEAEKKHISVDSNINLNAKYMAEEEMKKMKRDPVYAKIEGLKWSIRKNKKWLSDVTARAKERYISVDSCIAVEARWIAGNSYSKTRQDSLFEKIDGIKTAIKKDKKWLNGIIQRAKERNISVDSCIDMEAKWMAGIRNDKYRKELEKKMKIIITTEEEILISYKKNAKEKNMPLATWIDKDVSNMPEDAMKKVIQDYITERKNYYSKAIRKNKKWLSKIAIKAKEKNISLDSCINLDCKWMAEQDLNKM